MKIAIKYILLLLGICAGFLVTKLPVLAISESDYNREIANYREYYDAFLIKKDAYVLYKTLASEEELAAATRPMLIARNNVWVTYWQLMSMAISKEGQIPSDQKEEYLKWYESQIKFLNDNKTKLQIAKTRLDLIPLSNEINKLEKEYSERSYSGAVMYATYRLKYIFTKLEWFHGEYANRIATQQLTPQEREKKEGQLRSIKDQLLKLQVEMDKAFKEVGGSGGGSGTDEQSLSTLFRDLEGSYNGLKQIGDLVIELSDGVLW